METDQNKLLNRAIYPGLYVFTFVSYKSARYLPSFSLSGAILVITLLLLAVAALNWIFYRLSRSTFSAILTLVILLSMLHVATIAQLLGYSYAFIPKVFYLRFYSGILLLVIAATFLLKRIPAVSAAVFNKALNMFLLFAAAVFILQAAISQDWTSSSRKHTGNGVRALPKQKNKKDIVWILLDEYGSSAALARQFGFINPLDSQLTSRGYTVLPTIKSRFTNTLFSLNAIFNEDDSVPPPSFYAGTARLRNSVLVRDLDQAGYQFVNLGFFDLGKHPKLEDRSGYPGTYLQQVTSGTLFNAVVNGLKYNIPECDRYINKVVAMLGDTLDAKSSQPKFIWAHISIPHAPFCRNSQGELQVRSEFDEKDSTAIGSAYIGYLSYGNAVLNKIIQGHPELLEKIVVISGDHGPRYPFLKDKSYQNWPFAAVHFPGAYDSTALHRLRYISQIPTFIIHYLAGN